MQRFLITNADIGGADFHNSGAVLAIGNLDGVHKGHAALLEETKKLAAARGVPAAVMTFTPHPRLFFQPDAPPFLLTDDDGKAALLAEKGIDCLYNVRFDAALAEMSALDFIRSLPVGTVRCGAVVVGADFRFGKNRLGDTDILAQAGDAYGFTLHALSLVTEDAEAVSSSRIRDHIRRGETAAADALLGYRRRYSVTVLDSRPAEYGLTCLSAKPAHPALLMPKSGGYTGTFFFADTAQKVFILHNDGDLVRIFYDAQTAAPAGAGTVIALHAETPAATEISAEIAAWLAAPDSREQQTEHNKRESL